MSRLTLGAARPTIARALGVCETDARIPIVLNAAVERLLPRGHWKGTYGRYRFCINNACITLPRHIETIEAYALCRHPGVIRSEGFEFQETSYGVLGPNDCIGSTLVPRGQAVSFDDFTSLTQKAKVYSDVVEDPGAYILLQGYDENRNWIMSLVGSEWIDGERVLLSTSPQLSTHYFSSLTGVQKPVTKGNVRVYSYDVPSGANVAALSVYEPDETLPQYRRYMIPGLTQSGSCCRDTPCDDEVTCDQKQVDVLAKLAFIPVIKDTDYVIISNLQALKLAVMAMQQEENNNFNDADRLMEGTPDPRTGIRRGGAIPLLEEELANFKGTGAVVTPRFQDPALFGAGYVQNFT